LALRQHGAPERWNAGLRARVVPLRVDCPATTPLEHGLGGGFGRFLLPARQHPAAVTCSGHGTGRTRSTYRAFDTLGNVEYVGMTINFARRGAEHLRAAGRQIIRIPGLNQLSKADARAVEQAMIELHEVSKNGGTLSNKINSIATTNPDYAALLARGQEILRQIGYK
jgi:hypothetical protein